ncbi:MAG TPA: hypothetical protein VM842_05040, partial [Nitrospira sp.]|nr:hypothetical protein [Nitrospira sp.]
MAQTHVQGNFRTLKSPSRAADQGSLLCAACQGHLVADLYIDTVDAGGHVWVRALRCVQCRKIAGGEREEFRAASPSRKIGRIPKELPEWG